MTRFHCGIEATQALAAEHGIEFKLKGKPKEGESYRHVHHTVAARVHGEASKAVFGRALPGSFRLVEEHGEPIIEVD